MDDITTCLYCKLLQPIIATPEERRASLVSIRIVFFHEDNLQPYRLKEFEGKTISQPPYLPDNSPYDYHFFCKFENHVDRII